jgi:hypothetical protein
LIQSARVCSICPVRKQCEDWANEEARDGEGELGFLAAGYLYSRRGYDEFGPTHRVKVEWKRCDLPDCNVIMPVNNAHKQPQRFCSPSCAAFSRRRVAS